MSYSEILSKAIERSGLTLKEICERCSSLEGELKVKITESYISQLRSGTLKTPSVKVSTALAHVLEIDADTLILQSYIDNAPAQLIRFLKRIRFFHKGQSLYFTNEELINREKQIDKYEHFIEQLDKEPLSEFVTSINSEDLVQTAENYSLIYSKTINCIEMDDLKVKRLNNPNLSFEEVLNLTRTVPINYEKGSFKIEDDSLEPLIQNGSILIVDEKNFAINDLVHCWDIKNEKYIFRKYYIKDETIILTAINPRYSPLIYNKSDIIILGKVTSYIGNIDF